MLRHMVDARDEICLTACIHSFIISYYLPYEGISEDTVIVLFIKIQQFDSRAFSFKVETVHFRNTNIFLRNTVNRGELI